MTSSKHHGGAAPNGYSFERGKRSFMVVENNLDMDIDTHPYREAV